MEEGRNVEVTGDPGLDPGAQPDAGLFPIRVVAELTGITAVTMDPGWVKTRLGGSQAPLQPEESISGMLQVIDGLSQCQATQVPNQTFTEVDASEACAGVELEEGDSETCTFEYTTFYEGIPTVGAYGKTLMVLLLLGIGFVAVRRFA